MAVDFQALRDLDLTELRNRVDAWNAVTGSMTDSVALYSADVHAAMDSDDWAGAAAEQAGIRSGELHALIEAGATEAAAVRDILSTGVERFGAAKTALTDAIAQVDAIAELRITDGGKVELDPAAGGGLVEALWAFHISNLQGQVDSAIDDAQTADEEIAEALSLASETDNGADNTFNGQALDLEALAQTRADADRVVELFRSDNLPLSPDALRELNSLLDGNTGNPVFAERLMSGLGPAELLIQSEVLMSDTEGDDAELDDEILANLGETLATATNTDNQPRVDTEWVGEFMTEGAATGYLSAAPLLEHGDYHEDFIVPVAEHLIRLEGVRDDIGVPYPDPGENSPLTSALSAVERNPAAATSLLTGSDAYRDMPYVDGGGDELEPADDNVTALLDIAADGNYPELLDDAVLGGVIESGATGLSSQTPDGVRVEHSPRMAEVANSVVEYVADNPGEFAPDGDLSPVTPHLGVVAADYMEDIHRTYADDGDGSMVPPTISVDAAGNPVNAFAGRDDASLNQFLAAISRDPDAYATTMGGSLAVLERTVEPALAASENSDQVAFGHLAQGHGTVMGVMDQGWTEIVNDEHLEAAENRNGFLDALSKGVTAGGFIPHPAAGPISTGVNELVLGPAMEDNLAEASSAAEGEVEEINENNRRSHDYQVQATVEHMLTRLGHEDPAGAAASVSAEFFQTYGSARQLVEND
ncbi:hypothetical protein [Stackebrandtia nassauensis]|uniref:Uncharacterized protein n=1 Tax=Stackebrandtia nassauensis (strain DSM 44728 / CIP 108903 / NRRL B-16338 / NBRC 102104 / LLR-40K-21) TaxID=446470 RepID=D3PZU0_STANL|nr:hypothetical protein [Stackebrandtia nassauensis]ADD43627.1 hypothetical protein Snas_3975 [Stackebrandtia nassauensis DSM 44728]